MTLLARMMELYKGRDILSAKLAMACSYGLPWLEKSLKSPRLNLGLLPRRIIPLAGLDLAYFQMGHDDLPPSILRPPGDRL